MEAPALNAGQRPSPRGCSCHGLGLERSEQEGGGVCWGRLTAAGYPVAQARNHEVACRAPFPPCVSVGRSCWPPSPTPHATPLLPLAEPLSSHLDWQSSSSASLPPLYPCFSPCSVVPEQSSPRGNGTLSPALVTPFSWIQHEITLHVVTQPRLTWPRRLFCSHLQPHWPASCPLNLFLPQGLCICHSFPGMLCPDCSKSGSFSVI